MSQALGKFVPMPITQLPTTEITALTLDRAVETLAAAGLEFVVVCEGLQPRCPELPIPAAA